MFKFIQRFLGNTLFKGAVNSTERTQVLSLSSCNQLENLTGHLAMLLTKSFRHVQTQHGDDSADIENIILCKANIFTPNVQAIFSIKSTKKNAQ